MAYFRFEAKKCHLEVTASIQSAKKSTYAFQSLITNKKFYFECEASKFKNFFFFVFCPFSGILLQKRAQTVTKLFLQKF